MARKLSVSCRLLLACLCSTLAPTVTQAAERTFEQLLPASTQAFVSVRDMMGLSIGWDKTQLGQLLNDPVMKPFADHLREQLDDRITQTRDRIGLTVAELESLGGGELAIAVVRAADGKPAVVTLVDITDHEPQADRVLEKIASKLISRGAKRTIEQVDEGKISVYQIPARPDLNDEHTLVYFRKDSLLGVTNHAGLARSVLQRVGKASTDTLAHNETFNAVMQRCQIDSGDHGSDLEFFVDPLGLALAVRDLRNRPTSGGQDLIKILKEQGFGAIQGVGGCVQLAVGPYDCLYRVAVHAPKPYELAMRMLEFPVGADFTPPAWVPRDVVSYRTFYWNVQNAFDRFDTLFDATIGEGEPGVFADILMSTELDPDGPGINIRRELIAHLGQRTTIISDHQLPVTKTSRRRLFAIELTDAEAMARNVARSMDNDPAVVKRQVNGHTVYEIISEDEDFVPAVAVDASLPGGFEEVVEDDLPRFPNAAITVALGQLFVASDVDLLEKVLAKIDPRESLARDVDFQVVNSQLQALGIGSQIAHGFVRNDEQMRLAYELFRTGQLPGAKLPLAQFLDAALGDGIKGIERQPKLDGSRLPDYQVVRRYLGASGGLIANDDNGWLIVGFTLDKDTPVASRPGE